MARAVVGTLWWHSTFLSGSPPPSVGPVLPVWPPPVVHCTVPLSKTPVMMPGGASRIFLRDTIHTVGSLPPTNWGTASLPAGGQTETSPTRVTACAFS